MTTRFEEEDLRRVKPVSIENRDSKVTVDKFIDPESVGDRLIDAFPAVLDDIDGLLTENRVFKQRNVDIGVVSEQEILDWGFSGVMVRGSGLAWDLRRAQPYECYDEFDFKVAVGKNGDSFDRYIIRMLEMRESVKIMRQALEKLETCKRDPVMTVDGKVAPLSGSSSQFGVELDSLADFLSFGVAPAVIVWRPLGHVAEREHAQGSADD